MKASVRRNIMLFAVVFTLSLFAAAQRSGASGERKRRRNNATHGGWQVDFNGYWGRLSVDEAQEAAAPATSSSLTVSGILKGTVEGFQRWLTHFEKDGQISVVQCGIVPFTSLSCGKNPCGGLE